MRYEDDICGFGWNVLETIAMKFDTGIHAPLRTNCNNFGDALTFHLAPSLGHN